MAVLHVGDTNRRPTPGPALATPQRRQEAELLAALSSAWSTLTSRYHTLTTTPTPTRAASAQLTAQAQQLATDLLLDPRQQGRILGVTSPLGGEGKSLLAAAVALSLSRATHKRTVLVEGTWQRPTLSSLFDLPARPGLAEWLRGECDGASIRHEVSERLTVIPAGVTDNELLLLERLRDLGLSALAGPDDFIVVDLPSVLSSPAGRLAAGLAERLVVVARAGATPLPALADTCGQLQGLAIQGIVINQVERWIPRWLERVL